MRIAALKIKNFRGIREGYVRLEAHTVFIGTANVGKTTIIEALALLFGRDRLIRELTEHDFTGSCPAPADRIMLVATITGFPTEDHIDHPEWFRDGRAVPKYLDPATGQLHPARISQASLLACQVGLQARFDHDSLLVETIRYFHDDDAAIDPFDGETNVVQVPPRLIGDLGFFLVRAARTWDGMISFGSELFRRIISSIKGQPATAVLAERDRLRTPVSPIEQDPKLRPLIERIDAELARLLPTSAALRLRVSTTDSRGVLDSVVAHFAAADGLAIPVNRQGTGLISLQGLLLLLELARGRVDSGGSFIIAVEEPELHVPPPSQSRLVRRIQALAPQSIITTHSAAVGGATDPMAVLLLRNEGGNLVAEPLLRSALTDDAPNYVRKYFLDGRQSVIAALMHESLLIPEGRGEADLLGSIARALDVREPWTEDPRPLFSLEVGVIPTHDATVVATRGIFSRLHHRVFCLVDGDDEGERYVRELLEAGHPAARVLRWPARWRLEELAGWLIEPDERNICAHLGGLDGPPTSATEVVALLKVEKANVIVYETVASAIAESTACAALARDVLAAIATVCKGGTTTRFQRDAAGVMVFVP